MLMRSIGATLILSGVAASAIALAQSPKKAANQPGAQVADGEVPTLDSAAQEEKPAGSDDEESPAPKRGQQSADVLYVQPLPGTAAPAYAPVPAGKAPAPFSADPNPFDDHNPYSAADPFGAARVQVARAYPARALSPEEIQQAKEFRDAVEQLRQAQSDFEKTAARDRLSQIVSAQLDRDLEAREKKLAEIEARSKELREQLEHRRNSKGEIQKMLLMLIENPEAGLGLPPAWMNSVMNQPGAVTVLAAPPGVAPATTPQYAPLKRPPNATYPTAPPRQ